MAIVERRSTPGTYSPISLSGEIQTQLLTRIRESLTVGVRCTTKCDKRADSVSSGRVAIKPIAEASAIADNGLRQCFDDWRWLQIECIGRGG